MSPPAGGAQLLQSLLMACEDKAMFKKTGRKTTVQLNIQSYVAGASSLAFGGRPVVS